jgi:quercetin dioxygenase-like cupin family protein
VTVADDPVCTDPDKYRTVFENDRVRVLEYRDMPGAATQPHRHPDSVMVTLSGFERRLQAHGTTREVSMEPGQVHWLPAQVHQGENIGSTDTHVIFVELKGGDHVGSDSAEIGPAPSG